MPWLEINEMEQKTAFINAWLSQRYSKIELCRQFNISRPTADKWIKRHYQFGLAGLEPRSRKPHNSPNATAQWIVEWLITEKLKRPDWGAKKLLDLFARRFPNEKKPADSTGDLILGRAGLVKPRKRRRTVPADRLPFGECNAPNATWSVDFKGEFKLRNQQWCYPLTVSDNYSRFLFCCEALPSTKAAPVFQRFEQLFCEYGLPWAIRSDNGTPFASKALGGISQLAKWWIDLGIRPERIKPSHPEQNGQHERMHRNLKDSLTQRIDMLERDFVAQQAKFDVFVEEYNHDRSHEGLARRTPASVYVPSNRIYTGKIEPYDYGDGVEIRQVKGSGEVKWRGETYYLSQILAHEKVAFVPYADGVWQIFYRFHALGKMYDREKKIVPATSWHTNEM